MSPPALTESFINGSSTTMTTPTPAIITAKLNSISNGITNGTTNGFSKAASQATQPLRRAEEVNDLVDAVKALIIPYIKAADEAAAVKGFEGCEGEKKSVLVESLEPQALIERLKFSLPLAEGRGRDGVLDLVKDILHYSVNTWDQGFMDKLSASTDAVGVISEMLLATLNANVHVYHVSPALTVIEKTTARTFARFFGFNGQFAGGMTCQGGSASNLTSLLVARGALYPETKSDGNDTRRFVVFTSENSHYSIKKAAMALGMGTSSVISVPADDEGRMDTTALRALVLQTKAEGRTPLYVNATAGTTVLGAFDPLREVSAICKEFGLWMHVDASWGGPCAFSAAHRHKLDGSELANSLTVNPHKMLNVPATCSFLLTNDTRVFHKANTLSAEYLFHRPDGEDEEIWDIADLTMQCGRRGDSLKLALSWTFHGAGGYEKMVDRAFGVASHMATMIEKHPDFYLVSQNPTPCLQVCFYYAPSGALAETKEGNTKRTKQIIRKLVSRGFMIDFAPGNHGYLVRAVVNFQTLQTTIDGLMHALEEIGKEIEL